MTRLIFSALTLAIAAAVVLVWATPSQAVVVADGGGGVVCKRAGDPSFTAGPGTVIGPGCLTSGAAMTAWVWTDRGTWGSTALNRGRAVWASRWTAGWTWVWTYNTACASSDARYANADKSYCWLAIPSSAVKVS